MPVTTERQRLRDIYAARTTIAQKSVESFASGIRRHLGRAATILTPTNTHLTILESYGLKQKLAQYGYGSRELVAFAGGLSHYLDKGGHSTPIKAKVDPYRPLRWMTRRGNVWMLAYNIERNEQLLDARGRTEEYVVNQIGVWPSRTPFAPHVTLGKVSAAYVTPEIHRNPELLVPPYLQTPQYLPLNGLRVYLDRIHEVSRPLAALEPTIESSQADMPI